MTKKILSVVLALAMVLGMTATSFAATTVIPASTEANVEVADVVEATEVIAPARTANGEAADVMKAVGVFVGDENGNLNLGGKLTRAQAAKIVAYLMLGNEAAEAYEAEAVFEDVNVLAWYAKYVTYCAKEGIVNGYDETTFGPEDPVTGVQFGKMLLCCLGYEVEAEKLLGAEWGTNAVMLMNSTGIAAGVANLNAELTRGSAVQLCFNALKATVVEYVDGVATPVALAKTVKETIYNDDKLQLGEKLYKGLTLTETKNGRVWKLNGVEIGTYSDEEPEETKEELNINEKVTLPLLGSKKLLGKAEVLFSKTGEAKSFKKVMLAHPGEKIYVKANRLTLNLFEYFGGKLPEIVVSNTENAYDAEEVINGLVPILNINFSELADQAKQQAWINTLKFVGEKITKKDYTIELTLESEEVKAGEAAVYSFIMPDRMVTAYDFDEENIETVTFFNRTLTKKTIYVKDGELTQGEKIEIEPFKAVTKEVKDGENLYVISLPRLEEPLQNTKGLKLFYQNPITLNQLYVLKSNLLWF